MEYKRNEIVSHIENSALVQVIKELESNDIASPTMLLHTIALDAKKHDYPDSRLGLTYNGVDQDNYPTFLLTMMDQPVGIIITERDSGYSNIDSYIVIRSMRPFNTL